MPMRRAVLMIRQAISPRLAIRMRLNMPLKEPLLVRALRLSPCKVNAKPKPSPPQVRAALPPEGGEGNQPRNRPGHETKQRHQSDFDGKPAPPGDGADGDLAERVRHHRDEDRERGVVWVE